MSNLPSVTPTLQGKNLLFTNAINPIGRYVILNAVKQKANIILADSLKKSAELDAILTEISALGLSQQVKFIAAETAVETEVEQLVDTVMQTVNSLDGVMLCVPYTNETALPPLHELTQLQWQTILNEQLNPLFFLTRRLIEELLIQGNGGKLLCLTLPVEKANTHAVYNAVQTATYSYCRSITKEYGRRNILCNVITPALSNKQASYYASLAELALYFLSDTASFITGEVIKPETFSG